MKIHDLTTKKALEVSLTDLLVIEDEEDTKAITVAEFMECVGIHTDRSAKELINDTLDNVIKALENAKYKFDYDKFFTLNIWIGSDSGNVQFSIFDTDTKKWLTRDELIRLLGPIDEENYEQEVEERKEWVYEEPTDDKETEEEPKRTYVVKLFIDDERHDCVSYSIRDFKEDHAEGTNAWLEADNAGYVKAHFDNLTHNQIASITHENLSVTMDEYTDENRIVYHYHFVSQDESFANSVAWVGSTEPPFGEPDYPTPSEPVPSTPSEPPEDETEETEVI